jgi:hypothetical protein
MTDAHFVVTSDRSPDGTLVIFIDTDFEPDGSDGKGGMRLYINDDLTYEGVPCP